MTTKQSWSPEFVARQDWHFSRNEEGRVRIMKRRRVSHDTRIVDAEFEVDAATWCSIIAHLTPTRETRETWEQANALHMPQGHADKPQTPTPPSG